MQSILDRYLGIDPAALVLEGERTRVLASNLANVDTPGYKARDLDFKAALAAAAGSDAAGTLALATPDRADLTAAGTPAGAAGAASPADARSAAAGAPNADAFLRYRVPLAPSLDANTVDEQLEEAAFAQNSVRYQATLTFLNTKLRDLLTAIGSQ